jgi:hypothetical protein
MEPTRSRARDRRLVARSIAALLLGFAILLQIAPPTSRANDLSRWNTVYALNNSGSYAIDGFPMGATKDHVLRVVAGESHFYSSKPAVMATWVAAVYQPLFRLGWPLDARSRGIILAFVNLLPLGLFLWFYWRYLEDARFGPATRFTAFAVAAAGTYLPGTRRR